MENSPQLPQSDGEFDLVNTENSEKYSPHSCSLNHFISDHGVEANGERARE